MKRLFLIGAGMLAGGLSALASVDNGLIALIPANASLVAGIDVTQCKNSQFGQYLLTKSQADDAHFEEFMTQTGFDPRQDLENVVVASMGDGAGKRSSFVILARGSFNQDKITALAVSKGAVANEYKGVSLLVSKEHGQQTALAFPDPNIAVMGDVASVQQVVQNLSAPADLSLDLTNRIDSAATANDAWFVSTTGAGMFSKQFSATTGTQMNGQMQALQAIHSASGGVKFGTTVAVSLDAGTRSAQDATSLADVFRFLASMVQMQRQQNPQAAVLASAMDNMQLQTDGQTLHIGFSVSEKNLEQMAEMGAKK